MSAPAPWLVERAEVSPEALAIRLPSGDLTWADLRLEATRRAAALASVGVEPGDVVATLLDSPDFAVAVHAIWLRGATVLPLSLRSTRPEIGFQLRDASARALLHGRDALAERALELSSERPEMVCMRGDAATEPGSFAPTRRRRSEPHAILYTSGTTGRPKGAVLTGAAFEASARASRDHLGSRLGDRCLACMPLFHVGGLSILVRAVLLGASVRIQPGFEPQAVDLALDRDGITDVSFVADMLARVLDHRGERPAPAALRVVLLGGGPIPEPLLARARAFGWPVAPTYGLTEAASQVATRPPGDLESLGLRPLPGVEVRVEAPPGGEGEILVRGPNVMQGYLGLPDETARTLNGGWLHTGDIGRIELDGTLTVLDRRRDLIVSGGENVYPAQVESVLADHPAVAEVAVAGEPDERFGARPVAWFVARPGASVSEAELIAFCRERLAAYKAPVACREVDALPRTSTGKLDRTVLSDVLPRGAAVAGIGPDA